MAKATAIEEKEQLDFLAPVPPPVHRPRHRRKPSSEHRGMVRVPDHETSVEAAERAAKTKERDKEQVYMALVELGPMTDGELSSLERFRGRPVSTIAKRRGDLCREDPPRVEDSGLRRGHPDRPDSMMKVWRAIIK